METGVTGHCQSLPEKYGFNLDATGCHPERSHGHASAADMNQGMAVNNRNPIQNLRNLLQTVQTYKLKNSETSKSSNSEAGSCGLSTTTSPAQSELESNGDFPKKEDRKPIFSFPPVSKLIFSLSNIPKTEKEQKCVTSQSCSVTSASSQLNYSKPKTLKLEKEFKYNIDHSTNCNPNLQDFPEVEYSDTTATYGTDTTSSPSSPPPRKLKTLGGDDNDSQNCAATSLEANASHQFCESFTLTPPHSLTGSDTSPNDIPEDDETDCKITVTPANEELSSNFKKTDDIIGGQVSPILNDNQINNTNHTRASKDNQEHESVQNEDACEEMQTIIDDDLESLIEEIPLINLQVILERCDNIIPTRKPYNSEIKIEPQSPSSEFENESSEFPKMEHQPVKAEQNMGFNFKVPSPVVKKRMKKQSLKVAKASLLQCSICHKSFISEATKKRHVLLYHTVRDRHYPCELCGKNFLSQPVLYDHLRRHFGEKPFQCEICKKRFVSSGELYVHKKRTHFKDLPYCCPTCSKRFLFRFELAQHFIKYKTHAKGNEI